jgi:hypothetical protein
MIIEPDHNMMHTLKPNPSLIGTAVHIQVAGGGNGRVIALGKRLTSDPRNRRENRNTDTTAGGMVPTLLLRYAAASLPNVV